MKNYPPIAVKYWPIYKFIWLAPCGRRTCAILKELVKSYSDIRGINDRNRDVYSFCPRYWKHLENIILSHGHPISLLFHSRWKGSSIWLLGRRRWYNIRYMCPKWPNDTYTTKLYYSFPEKQLVHIANENWISVK